MPRALLMVLSGALLGLCASADGQMCAGFASFAQGPYQVFGTAGLNNNAKSFAGGFGFGGAGPFGEVSVGTANYDNIDGSSLLFGGGLGYQVTLGQKGIVHLCPTASLGFLSGPNNLDVFGDGSVVLDLSETDVAFGLALGVLASGSNPTQIIPVASLGVVNASAKASDDVSGTSQSNTQTFGSLELGLGFVFNQVVSFRSNVAIPIGLDGGVTSFGATVSVNFGKPR